MSTSISDFINCWNETMPIQIQEVDIKNPNEVIFRKLLISLLKEFLIDTTPFDGIELESGSRLKASRTRLTAIVNHFYKIALPGAKQDFCLMDLIQPNAKKTFSVLNYLHNYCVFVRHTYASTIVDLKEKMTERDELLSAKNNLRKELEEAKIQDENNVKAIKELDIKIPRYKEKLSESKEKSKKLKNEIAALKEEFERSEIQIFQIKKEISEVQAMFVSEEEIESIISTKESIAKESEQQDQIVSESRQKFQDTTNSIKEASQIVAKMEAVYEGFGKMNTDDIKTVKKNLVELKKEVIRLKSKIDQNRSQYERLSLSLQHKKSFVEQLRKTQAEEQKNHEEKKAGLKKELKEKKNLRQKLVTEEEKLAAMHQRLREEQDRVFKIAANAMKHISRSLFEGD